MSLSPVVQQIYTDLKSPKHDVKQRASHDLLAQVSLASRELSAEKFQEFYQEVQRRIAQLVVISSDPNDKIGGIFAIEQLIGFAGDDTAQKTTKLSGYLHAALRSNDNEVLVYAAHALGLLATPGGALTAELVESEVKQALEWLQSERQEPRRFAAVLVIRELARNSPTLLYSYVPQILDSVWTAIRDVKVLIRETAAEAIMVCFTILCERDTRVRNQWFNLMYKEAVASLKRDTVESVHGSLLVLKELLRAGGMFMTDHYKDACDIALQFKSHRDIKIRGEVVSMIPVLAHYSPRDFISGGQAHKFMVFVSGQLKKEKERNAAFIAVGKLAEALGSTPLAPYLDGILLSIKDALRQRSRTREKDGAVFECISMLANAVGQTLTKYIEDGLLDNMLACGLSQPLTQALSDIAHAVSPVKPQVQDKLLDLLSLVLCGRPFRPLGCPENRLPPIPAFAKDWHQNAMVHGDPEIALALNVLGDFDFKGYILNEFVRDVALPYVKSSNANVRKAAARTSCQIYVQDPIIKQTSFHALGVVRAVVTQLLSAAVGDPVPEIRRLILDSLDWRFDKHLAELHNVRKVIVALNDPDFEVRRSAMDIVGRLTLVNPAYVYPPLRKSLQNYTMGIWSSDDPIFEEEGARLISLCAINAPQLVRPFVTKLIDILVPKTADSNANVAATMIRAIGDLSMLGGIELRPYISRLMPIIIEALQDLSSPNKRDSALRALGQLASNSGYVIQPYLDYPQLLDLLTNIIKTEQQGSLRRETIKLLGILGALDPYKHQQTLEQRSEASTDDTAMISDVSLIMNGLTPSNEDYYPQVVMNTLLNNILKDSSLAQYHTAVIEAIVSIFKTLGLKCIPFLPQIIPTFVAVINAAQINRLEQYFSQLAILVSIVRQHIRPYNTELVDLIKHYWVMAPSVQVPILSLVEALSRALGNEFYASIVKVLPGMVKVLEFESNRDQAALKILHTILVFGNRAERSMWLILPKIVRVFTNNSRKAVVRKTSIDTLSAIMRQTNVSDFSATILQALRETLSVKDKSIQLVAYECVLTFFYQYPLEMDLFVDSIKAALVSNGIPHTNFDTLCTRLRNNEPLPQDLRTTVDLTASEDAPYADAGQRKLPVNQEHLKSSWEASQKSTREDWQEWMRRFSVELLKESPSNALRACAGLASVYPPLAKDLFNSAFVSCWTELYDQYQEELVNSLELALLSPQIPPEILQMLLNLAEFMEHDDKPLPVDIGTLGRYAAKCHAYAKALHYKELEFEEEKSPGIVEALISINNQLQQTDAAVGILRNAQKYRDFELKETWFEKLGRWDEALEAYNQRRDDGAGSMDLIMGKMRCLHALGEWEALSSLAQEKWHLVTPADKKTMAPLAAAAAWGQYQWELMDDYLKAMKANSPDRSFFGAIAALHQNSFVEAMDHIERAREGLDTELSALLGESYTRAYGVVVRVQMLAELEEIIVYKKNEGFPEQQALMRETWRTRLQGCEGNVETWQRMLKVRALVLSPKDDIDVWIKFANLCRKSGRSGLAEKTLRNLRELTTEQAKSPTGMTADLPEVLYAQHKYNWSLGDHPRVLMELRDFTNSLADQCNGLANFLDAAERGVSNPMNVYHQSKPAELQAKRQDLQRVKLLLSKCFLRLGQWQSTFRGADWTATQAKEVLTAYNSATQYNPQGYKAWHAWALANFEIANAMATNTHESSHGFSTAAINDHVIPAMQGFFRSISLSKSKSTLQDTLRLLTLWFAHGAHPQVRYAIVEGFPLVSMDTWLEVIPQLIARISQPDEGLRIGVQRLLVEVGQFHPQALVFPLTVAMKSKDRGRADAAKAIMEMLRQRSAVLLDQAQLVSKELIRVAVLWHEQWHEGFEEASRLYFGDQNAEGMFRVLAPLHKQLEDGPETLREQSFQQAFGRELAEAKTWCERYRDTGDPGDLNQAWDLYHGVFRRIEKQLTQLTTLDLKYVSPQLEAAKNLELAAPGTYQSGKPVVRIQGFDKIFVVIISKQRPRKMSLRGSDGQVYTYALKGHEDIRQDERVMQLFGLVNTLLSNDADSFKRHLNIQRFQAIPLSQSSGLLGWVPHSDTMHNLIREYREARRILLNIEHRIMLQMAPQYDSLTLMQKVEVFNYAMDNTTGKDLYRILWLKSRSSEAWLERRTNYTRSLAVMSMVGYILGLGDRHPSNLMIDRVTGNVIHIDFGDCFEVAMHRDKFPERVHFRLTRMLTFAMEVSNIDGSFKISSEAVMRVIRENRESLIAVLEAFIHDPLLTWRLTTRESPYEPSFRSERRASLMGLEPGAAPGERPHSGSYMRELANAQTNGGAATSGRPDDASGRPNGTTRGHSASLRTRRRPSVGTANALVPAPSGKGASEATVTEPEIDTPQGGALSQAGAVAGNPTTGNANALALGHPVHGPPEDQREIQNARGLQVLARVKEKLNGTDFKNTVPLDVETQVAKLIAQATNIENTCQHYIGWCSFW